MVFHDQDGLFSKNVSAFLRLLEFMYCDKFTHMLTISQLRDIRQIASLLGLKNIHRHLLKNEEFLSQKLKNRIMRDFQIKQFQANGGDVPNNISGKMTAAVEKEI